MNPDPWKEIQRMASRLDGEIMAAERARDIARAYDAYRRAQTAKQAERAQKHNDRLLVEQFLATFKWEGR